MAKLLHGSVVALRLSLRQVADGDTIDVRRNRVSVLAIGWFRHQLCDLVYIDPVFSLWTSDARQLPLVTSFPHDLNTPVPAFECLRRHFRRYRQFGCFLVLKELLETAKE